MGGKSPSKPTILKGILCFTCSKHLQVANPRLRGGFKYFYIFNPEEMIQFDEHIFQMGWFNHQFEESAKEIGLSWLKMISRGGSLNQDPFWRDET